VGLEDVSTYPALVRAPGLLVGNVQLLNIPQITELFKRGWTSKELKGLTGGNLLRVLEGAELVAQELQKVGTPPVLDLYDKRTDLPVPRG